MFFVRQFICESDFLIFADMNECKDNSDNCSPFADCKNTLGSYKCICKPGFSGDGVTCVGKYLTIYILLSDMNSYV